MQLNMESLQSIKRCYKNTGLERICSKTLKGAVCRIDMVEMDIAVQIQNIGEGSCHPAPPSSDLMHTQVARLTTPTGTSVHDDEVTLSFPPTSNPGVPKYNWVNWQWAGFTNHNRNRHSVPERTFSKENN